MKWFRDAGRLPEADLRVSGAGTSAEMTIEDLWESPLDVAKFFVIDIETSGFSAETDKILSLAAGSCCGFSTSFTTFQYDFVRIDNPLAVPQKVWDLTGLSPNLLSGGRELADVLKDALALALGHVWIAHHARHELSFLQRQARLLWKLRLRPLVIDTAVVAQALTRLSRAPTLEEVCDWLHVESKNRHQADADVQMTAEVWRKEMILCQKLGLRTIAEVIDWSSARAMG